MSLVRKSLGSPILTGLLTWYLKVQSFGQCLFEPTLCDCIIELSFWVLLLQNNFRAWNAATEILFLIILLFYLSIRIKASINLLCSRERAELTFFYVARLKTMVLKLRYNLILTVISYHIFLAEWKLGKQNSFSKVALMCIIRHWLALILVTLHRCFLFSCMFTGVVCLLRYCVCTIGSCIEAWHMHWKLTKAYAEINILK